MLTRGRDEGNSIYGTTTGYLPFNAIAHNALIEPSYLARSPSSTYHSLPGRRSLDRVRTGTYRSRAPTPGPTRSMTPEIRWCRIRKPAFPRNSRALVPGARKLRQRHPPHRVVNYIYEMPLGRGKTHLASGAVGRILEGFQFGGIRTLQTGHAFDMYSITDNQHTGLSNRPDLVGDPFAPGDNTGRRA